MSVKVETIKISVALVTRNRPESLRRCLTSWRSQSVQPFEIIISDDSDDATRLEIQDIATQFKARWIAGPRRGLYANRNHVAAHCQGSHVFSADDDHEHPIDMLQKCLAAVCEEPDSAWCLGEVEAWDQIQRGWTVPGELQLNGASDRPRDFDHTWAWSDGASICPRQFFDSGLCFSETFRFGAAYLEFGCMLHAIRRRIRILQTTGVIHHIQQVGRSFSLPVEECASRFFAVMMLGLVYQPSLKNYAQLAIFFSKQAVRHPIIFSQAWPWAWREKIKRTRWYHQKNHR